MKSKKITKAMLTAGSLLANAYIAGRSGNAKKAGAFMVAACRTDALDGVMHGVATAFGMTEDEKEIKKLQRQIEEEMKACQEEEDIYIDAGCENCDEDDEDCICEEDVELFAEDEDDDDEDDDDEESEPEPAPVTASVKKIAIPASCARLARIRY